MFDRSKKAFEADRLHFAADWFVNGIPLPMSLPAPVSSPHDACKKAAKLIKRHSQVRSMDNKTCLHWALRDSGLTVQGGDTMRVVIKGSYRVNADDAGAGEAGGRGLHRVSVAQHSVRFFTRERKIYVPRSGGSMTATRFVHAADEARRHAEAQSTGRHPYPRWRHLDGDRCHCEVPPAR